MSKTKSETQYLILDKNDITKVLGRKSTSELMTQLQLTRSKLINLITYNTVIDNKFILVEDI